MGPRVMLNLMQLLLVLCIVLQFHGSRPCAGGFITSLQVSYSSPFRTTLQKPARLAHRLPSLHIRTLEH